MHEKIKPFIVLQALDTRRRALRKTLEDGLKRKAAAKADLAAAQAGKDKADEARRIREKHLMDAQLRLKGAEERLRQSEAKAMKISNAKEFAAINEQIAAGKKEISTLEDEVLGLMDAVEGVRRDSEFAAKALREQEERTKRIVDAVDAESSTAVAELERVDVETTNAEKSCDAEMLPEYRRLVRRPNAIGVAPAIGGVCQACFTRLPPQVENLLAGAALVACKSCQVLLYRD
ncbi:MAG TPA: hypothetical protein VEI02_14855 [Planctomycetota bacterium]|nr:hypothetical protein [Planctomycetota bacterium]